MARTDDTEEMTDACRRVVACVVVVIIETFNCT